VHDTSWSDRLSLDDAGRGLVGHAGAVLLRKTADVTGLTEQLSVALAVAKAEPAGTGVSWPPISRWRSGPGRSP
jgi:hypothetical protein